jgi:hypothetical protein
MRSQTLFLESNLGQAIIDTVTVPFWGRPTTLPGSSDNPGLALTRTLTDLAARTSSSRGNDKRLQTAGGSCRYL